MRVDVCFSGYVCADFGMFMRNDVYFPGCVSADFAMIYAS